MGRSGRTSWRKKHVKGGKKKKQELAGQVGGDEAGVFRSLTDRGDQEALLSTRETGNS